MIIIATVTSQVAVTKMSCDNQQADIWYSESDMLKTNSFVAQNYWYSHYRQHKHSFERQQSNLSLVTFSANRSNLTLGVSCVYGQSVIMLSLSSLSKAHLSIL